MTNHNFRRALHAFASRQPFLPFLVELVTGEQLEVNHPEAVMLRGEVIMFITTNDRNKLFDSNSVCQVCDLPSVSD